MTKVECIDYLADVKNILTETDKPKSLYKTGQMDFNQIRYIPGLINIADQGQIYLLQTKGKYASERYYQKNNLEFEITLSAKKYTNFNNLLICLPTKLNLRGTM